jgi:pimeloyl-ACP methyl ester carboxylesterase
MAWRWMKRGGGALSILTFIIVLLILFGLSYQAYRTEQDKISFPPPGQMVDVGGYRLHLYGMGEGSPSVILDAGMGCHCLDWALVQPEIAKFARVYSYDRAGNGWSEESPHPRTSGNITDELHTLLVNAGIKGPYVLVGHSFGGINLRLFAIRYPQDVLGIVLVDAAHEDQMEKLPPWPHTLLEKIILQENAAIFAAWVGVVRLINRLQSEFGLNKLPESIHDMYFANISTPKFIRTANQEFRRLQYSLEEVKAAAGFLGDLPLTVITAGELLKDKQGVYSEEFIKEAQDIWKELQKDLVSKSTQGTQMIAAESGHMVAHDQPVLIAEAVRRMVNDSKSK